VETPTLLLRLPFPDVAEVVGRTPAACRQQASSARRRIRSAQAPATRPSGRPASSVPSRRPGKRRTSCPHRSARPRRRGDRRRRRPPLVQRRASSHRPGTSYAADVHCGLAEVVHEKRASVLDAPPPRTPNGSRASRRNNRGCRPALGSTDPTSQGRRQHAAQPPSRVIATTTRSPRAVAPASPRYARSRSSRVPKTTGPPATPSSSAETSPIDALMNARTNLLT